MLDVVNSSGTVVDLRNAKPEKTTHLNALGSEQELPAEEVPAPQDENNGIVIRTRTTKEEWKNRLALARIRPRPITDEGKEIIIVGDKGIGKSSGACKNGLMSMRKGEYNAFNFDVCPPPWIDPKYCIRYKDIHHVMYRLPGIPALRIHLDEGATKYDARNFNRLLLELRGWVRELRKWRVAFIVYCQITTELDKTFRDQCWNGYTVSRHWKLVHKTKWTRTQDNFNGPSPWMPESILSNLWNWRDRFMWMRLRYFAMYNTYEHFQNAEPMDKKTEEKLVRARLAEALKEEESVTKLQASRFFNKR